MKTPSFVFRQSGSRSESKLRYAMQAQAFRGREPAMVVSRNGSWIGTVSGGAVSGAARDASLLPGCRE